MQSSPVGAPMVALPSGAIRPANPRSATVNAQGRPVFPPQVGYFIMYLFKIVYHNLILLFIMSLT